MKTIRIDDEYFEVASSLNELKRDQLLTLSGFIQNDEAGDRARVLAIMTLLGVGRTTRLQTKWNFLRRVEAIHLKKLYPYTDFLFSKDSLLTEQLLPLKLYGPRSRFSNLTFGEWIKCEAYLEQGKPNRLIAVLYRPAKAETDGEDIREKFSDGSLDAREGMIAQLSPAVKTAILLWYRGCRKTIMEAFRGTLFKKEVEVKATTEIGREREKAMSQPQAYSWANVLADIANDVTQLDRVSETYVWSVFFFLSRKIEKQKKS